jgi:hypothetical protein
MSNHKNKTSNLVKAPVQIQAVNSRMLAGEVRGGGEHATLKPLAPRPKPVKKGG